MNSVFAQQPKLPPVSAERQAALWAKIQTVFHNESRDFCTLRLNGEALGYLNAAWRERVCADWQGGLEVRDDAVNVQGGDWLALADALQNMAWQWHKLGLLHGWRNEKFDVTDSAGRPLFALERAAFRPLGLVSRAVHINGYTRADDGVRLWIARRSPFKAVDPNKLDSIVGGGISSGETVAQALCREGFEEAGLPESLLAGAAESGRQYSVRTVARGLHREWLHIFDVCLPADMLPENQDGEVADFRLMTVGETVDAMIAGQLMNDALLATADALWRWGALPAGTPLAQWLADGDKRFRQPETF